MSRTTASPPRRTAPPRRTLARAQAGLSLIEFMVSITIALFISIALGTIFVSSRNNFRNQDALSTLHDNQRLAMAILTTAVQQAGYFPDPVNTTSATAMPVDTSAQVYGQFPAAGGVTGASASGNETEKLATRYMTSGSDGVLDCQGRANASGTYVNVFSVSAAGDLQCAVNGADPVPLVSGVKSLAVRYGVDTSGRGGVDQYLDAATVQSRTLWGSVKSAQVTLVFAAPFRAGEVGAATSVTLSQTIGVMGSLG